MIKETESRLIEAKNNERKNDVKARIVRTQEISKYRLYGKRDETINYISKCSKLVQKEDKSRYVWVGKVIHYNLCK